MDIFENRDDLQTETRYVPIQATTNTREELVFDLTPDKRTLRLTKSYLKFSCTVPFFVLLDNDHPQKRFNELQFYMNNEVKIYYILVFYIFQLFQYYKGSDKDNIITTDFFHCTMNNGKNNGSNPLEVK